MVLPVIVLDLDETLIYTSEVELPGVINHAFEDMYICERPNLKQFIQKVARQYPIGIWTAAERYYAEFIVYHILYQYLPKHFTFEFLLTREHTIFSERKTGVLKNLDFVARCQHRKAFLIDDNPDPRLKKQLAHVYQIKPFTGDPKDKELLHVPLPLV